MDSVVHRFKSSLRTNLKIWKDDLNLICVSGGSASMALLDLMHNALFGDEESAAEGVVKVSQRKLFFRVHVLHVDEGRAVYGWSEEFHRQQIEMIKRLCEEKYKFTYTIVPIEAVFDILPASLDVRMPSPQEKEQLLQERKMDEANHATQDDQLFETVKNKHMEIEDLEAKRERFKALISSLPIESSFQEDLIFYLKKLMISDFCLRYNFKKALFGTTSHNVATQLLGQICKGRGASVAHEISFVDDKNFGGRISFMNPMRDFLLKEIALYNRNRKVEVILQEPLAKINQQKLARPTNAPSFASTDLLIQAFFSKLQDKYNVNTVPTVVRLTGKLKKEDFDGGDARPYPFCPLCLGVRDSINNLLEVGSIIKSIQVSKEERDPDQFITKTKDVPAAVQSAEEWFPDQLEQVLCFGCKRLAISARNRSELLQLLPDVVKVNGQ